MYKVNNNTFEKISEAKRYARQYLFGRAEDVSILVYEWQETNGDLKPGYWEAVAKASYVLAQGSNVPFVRVDNRADAASLESETTKPSELGASS